MDNDSDERRYEMIIDCAKTVVLPTTTTISGETAVVDVVVAYWFVGSSGFC